MSQFKKYLQIVTENYVYNESDYDLEGFPELLDQTRMGFEKEINSYNPPSGYKKALSTFTRSSESGYDDRQENLLKSHIRDLNNSINLIINKNSKVDLKTIKKIESEVDYIMNITIRNFDAQDILQQFKLDTEDDLMNIQDQLKILKNRAK